MKTKTPAKKAPSGAGAKAPAANGNSRTSSQIQSILGMIMAGGSVDLASWGGIGGASYATYRKMRTSPTLAIGRVAAQAPVKFLAARATWAGGKGDAEKVKFVKDALNPMWRAFVRECCNYGVDYGFQAFEVVWESRKQDGRLALLPKAIKPLLADITKPKIDEDTGELVGLTNTGAREVTLTGSQFAWYAHNAEAGNPWGSARLENCRQPWHAWESCFKKIGQYVTKVAGVIPMVEYPEGRTQDESGAMKDNFDLANAIMARLGSGHGVTMPNTLVAWAQEMVERGVDTSKMQAWKISFLEAGQHGGDLEKIIGYIDKSMLRGYIVPERAVLEGTHGTKADASAHGDLLISMGSEVAHEITECWNKYVVDPTVEANFGAEAVGTIRMSMPKTEGEDVKTLVAVLKQILNTPPGLESFMASVDLDAMLEQGGFPLEEGKSMNTEAEAAQAKADLLGLNVKGAATGAGNTPKPKGEDKNPSAPGGGAALSHFMKMNIIRAALETGE